MSPPVTQHLRAGLPGRLVAVSSQMPLSQGCARSLSPVFPFVRLAVRSDTAERQSLLLTVGSEDQDCRLFAASIILCIACVCTQSCPIFCNPVDCSPPGSPVRGILQARILEWVAISSSRGSSRTGDQTRVSHVSCIGRWVFCHSHHHSSFTKALWGLNACTVLTALCKHFNTSSSRPDVFYLPLALVTGLYT